MKIQSAEGVEQTVVEMEGAENCKVRQLVGKNVEAPNFAMREFEVAPGGFTPHHSHPYEHEIYVLAGQGIALEGSNEHTIKAGDVVYVAPNDIHQFKNTGDQPLKFLCLIPNSAINLPVTMAPECGTE